MLGFPVPMYSKMKSFLLLSIVTGVFATPQVAESPPAIQNIAKRQEPSTFKASFPDDPTDHILARKDYSVIFTNISEQSDPQYPQAGGEVFKVGHAEHLAFTQGASPSKFVPHTKTIYNENDIAAKVYVALPAQLPWRLVQDIAALPFTGPKDVFFGGFASFRATVWRGKYETPPEIQPVGIVVVAPLGWEAHQDAMDWALRMSGARDIGVAGVVQPDGSVCVGVRCREIYMGKGDEVQKTKCGRWRVSWRYLACRAGLLRSSA